LNSSNSYQKCQAIQRTNHQQCQWHAIWEYDGKLLNFVNVTKGKVHLCGIHASFLERHPDWRLRVVEPKEDGKNPAAVALGRLGGLKGGTARAKALSPEQRREIAQKAARARWGKRFIK
jgi:hypothetical protein